MLLALSCYAAADFHEEESGNFAGDMNSFQDAERQPQFAEALSSVLGLFDPAALSQFLPAGAEQLIQVIEGAAPSAMKSNAAYAKPPPKKIPAPYQQYQPPTTTPAPYSVVYASAPPASAYPIMSVPMHMYQPYVPTTTTTTPRPYSPPPKKPAVYMQPPPMMVHYAPAYAPPTTTTTYAPSPQPTTYAPVYSTTTTPKPVYYRPAPPQPAYPKPMRPIYMILRPAY